MWNAPMTRDVTGIERQLVASIVDAAPEFSGPASPLLRLASTASGMPVRLESEARKADIVFHSDVVPGIRKAVHVAERVARRRSPRTAQALGAFLAGPRVRTPRPQANIWYSGENIPPPVGFDATLSFETDFFSGSNAYLPYWFFT